MKRRKARGLSQKAPGHAVGVDRTTIFRWESGDTEPQPAVRPRLAEVLGISLGELSRLIDREDMPQGAVWLTPENVRQTEKGRRKKPVDDDYLDFVRDRIAHLVEMDLSFGGDQSSALAVQALVTGWLLYDAAKHGAARDVNRQALRMSRTAGDHAMELLVMQNMAMHAAHLGRPVEALTLARQVLESNRLPPRLEALFRTREARALAQGGDISGALDSFAKARSLYLEGVCDGEPYWFWWINDQEILWHEGMIYADLGRWSDSLEALQRSIEVTPAREGVGDTTILLHYWKCRSWPAPGGIWNRLWRACWCTRERSIHLGLMRFS